MTESYGYSELKNPQEICSHLNEAIGLLMQDPDAEIQFMGCDESIEDEVMLREIILNTLAKIKKEDVAFDEAVTISSKELATLLGYFAAMIEL